MSNTRHTKGVIHCSGKPATCRCPRHWGVAQATEFPDDAKRFSDVVNLHLTALSGDAVGQWVAVSLADGRTDNTLYPSRSVAAAHQSDEDRCLYFCIPPDGLTPKEAAVGLQWHRAMYDAGLRYRTMDGQELIKPLANERVASQLAMLQALARRS